LQHISFFVGPIELLLQILYILVGNGTFEMIGVKPNCGVFDHYQKKHREVAPRQRGRSEGACSWSHVLAMFIHASNLGSTDKLSNMNRKETKQVGGIRFCSGEFEQLTVLVLEFPK